MTMYSAPIPLTLTQDEAFTLRMVLDRIEGHPTDSRRKHTESVLQKLIRQFVEYDDELSESVLKGELKFENEQDF